MKKEVRAIPSIMDTTDENQKGKKIYKTPTCESHSPLEIVSDWHDQSSELQF